MLSKTILNYKTVVLNFIFVKTVLETLVLFKSREDIKYKSSILLKPFKDLLINKISHYRAYVHYYALCTRVVRSLWSWQRLWLQTCLTSKLIELHLVWPKDELLSSQWPLAVVLLSQAIVPSLYICDYLWGLYVTTQGKILATSALSPLKD
jgi:hypothetical protein